MKRTARGFTLVELLVVIAIIAILAAVVVLVINPIELTKRSRDASRMTDLANLQQAINIAVQEATGSSEAILCAKTGAAPCTAESETGGRTNDGEGWVMVDFSAQKSVSVSTLPVDPTNSGIYVYTYKSNGVGWEINAVLESESYKSKMDTDGGNADKDTPPAGSAARYEVGTDLTII